MRGFPEDVVDVFGYALHLAQMGDMHPKAKRLTEFGGGVLEVVDDFAGDTYRVVYTVSFSTGVYALHAFQKKSRHGIATPKQDIERISTRLKWAEEIHKVLLAKSQPSTQTPQKGKRR